jgi:murein L,D-transpeptidase YcbB/YkuD
MLLRIFLLSISFLFLYADNEVAPTPIEVKSSVSLATIKKYALCHQLIEYKKAKRFSHLNSPTQTATFYTDYCKRLNNFAWFDKNLNTIQEAKELLSSIDDSYDDGLNPEKYHKGELTIALNLLKDEAFTSDKKKIELVNDIDILFTDAYLSMVHDLYYGFTDWEKFQGLKIDDEPIAWERAIKEPIYPQKRLFDSLRKNSIKNSLVTLNPDFKEYGRLVKALAFYRSLEKTEKITKIPFGPSIRLNYTDSRLPLIKQRLFETQDLLEINNTEQTIYNENDLIDAVKKFQTRNNLLPDGRIGNKTVKAMNISISDKVQKIILNLERFRWLNTGMDKKDVYLNVNIPAFSMQVLEKGNELFHMNVIVGSKERPTPILSSKLSYAVVNPTWTAPQTIIQEDILGKKNLLQYLDKHNMHVFRQINGEMIEQDPQAINWEPYIQAKAAPFTFKADSGKKNPLGVVKFIFPNKYSIYMHDTNSRGLFKNDYRALSSGCVRLGEPKKLLTYLSPKEDIITKDTQEEKRVDLAKRPPILIRYMTVGVDASQNIFFYDDIYGYDDLLLQTIKKINFAKCDLTH